MAGNFPRRAIELGSGLIFDPLPALMPPLFQSYDRALLQLRKAVGDPRVLEELRRFLARWIPAEPLTDHQVIHESAKAVGQGRAAIRPKQPPASDIPWDQVAKDLGRFEGDASHLYLDTKGYATVGIGRMLPDAEEAETLNFTVRATGQPATKAQIAAYFAKVHTQPAGQRWQNYHTDLDLPQDTINRLAIEIAKRSSREVAARYKNYDKYPVEVKQVLIDMRFNMRGNMDKFKKFKTAVEQAYLTHSGKLWEEAARESYRRDVQPARNQWASDMILKGGGVKR